MHDPRTRLSLRGIRACRRGRDQGLDQLVPEACNLRSAHVAPDHSVGQARLEYLIDNAAAPPEIRLAGSDEVVERQLLGSATALRLQHAYCRVRIRQSLHLPDA